MHAKFWSDPAIDKPLSRRLKSGSFSRRSGSGFQQQKRNQADHGSDLHGKVLTVGHFDTS
jgi:hypothetical protein